MIKKPMTPFDTYKEYLGYKNHFTKEKYDYHKYGGKSRAKIDSFYKRKDRYFFEKMSRKYKDNEIRDFFLANFVDTDNPQGLWIGNIIRSGEGVYRQWQRRQQSMYYNFKQKSEDFRLAKSVSKPSEMDSPCPAASDAPNVVSS